MKAVVWNGPGQIDLEDVADARIEEPTDAVVRLIMSAICGTDLHMVRGTMPGMRPGTVLGHEGVGVVEAVGSQVRGFRPGDRVVIPPPSAAAPARTAGPATPRSAAGPTRTARPRERRSSGDRSPRARCTGCRRPTRAFRSPRRT